MFVVGGYVECCDGYCWLGVKFVCIELVGNGGGGVIFLVDEVVGIGCKVNGCEWSCGDWGICSLCCFVVDED